MLQDQSRFDFFNRLHDKANSNLNILTAKFQKRLLKGLDKNKLCGEAKKMGNQFQQKWEESNFGHCI